VCDDLTRPDGPPTTQPSLMRLPGRAGEVDLFLKEVARRLAGRLPEQGCRNGKPTTALQSEAWVAAAAYLDARLHVEQQEVANTPGHTGRKPDMSPAAGLAFRAVMAEVADEDVDNEGADLANPNDTVADGVAAEHAPQARVEAARKMYRNHEVLLKDLTRADGPPVSQPGLSRLPGREKDVELFLREVARRLTGRLPEQGCRHTKPTSAQQLETWAAAAAYLASRLQVSAREVARVPNHTGRKPDMSPPAGLALRAVLAEVASE